MQHNNFKIETNLKLYLYYKSCLLAMRYLLCLNLDEQLLS